MSRSYNRKATKRRHIRVGVSVNTPHGPGIVTYREKDRIVVAHPHGIGFVRYHHSIEDVQEDEVSWEASFENLIRLEIESEAVHDNQLYEVDRAVASVQDIRSIKGVKMTVRKSPTAFTTWEYLRLTKDGSFDFEIVTYPAPLVGTADLLAYAKGERGTVAYVDGNGWIRRKRYDG